VVEVRKTWGFVGFLMLGLVACGDSVPLPVEQPGALRYRPEWVPDGVVERSRTANLRTGDLIREWWPASQQAYYPTEIIFTVRVDSGLPSPTPFEQSEPVRVNDISGVLITYTEKYLAEETKSTGHRPNQVTTVAWRPPTGGTLTVQARGVEAASALRMARSVVPDSTTKFADALKAAWLPRDGHLTTMKIDGTAPEDWSVNVEATESTPAIPQGPSRPPRIRIAPRVCDESGDPVTVRGLPAHHFSAYYPPKGSENRVSVRLQDGRCLTVNGFDTGEVFRIADNLTLPATDFPWLGR
jgi:hypothetical protein